MRGGIGDCAANWSAGAEPDAPPIQLRAEATMGYSPSATSMSSNDASDTAGAAPLAISRLHPCDWGSSIRRVAAPLSFRLPAGTRAGTAGQGRGCGLRDNLRQGSRPQAGSFAGVSRGSH